MVRSVARAVLGRVRRFNRWWIDRLDPDARSPEPAAWDAPEPEAPGAPSSPAPVAAAPEAGRAARVVEVWAESTPNPNAVKFVCSVPAIDGGALTWRAGDRTDHPLGAALLAIPGVASAFAVGDFVTVTRRPTADWDTLAPEVEAALRRALA